LNVKTVDVLLFVRLINGAGEMTVVSFGCGILGHVWEWLITSDGAKVDYTEFLLVRVRRIVKLIGKGVSSVCA
jgi:hypothetical protein